MHLPRRWGRAMPPRAAVLFHFAAVVQSAGEGCRLKAQMLRKEFNLSGPMLHLLRA